MSRVHSIEYLLSRADETGGYRALWVALFLTIALLLMWVPWQGNEEHYFQLAYRTFSPESFSEFHAAFDQSAGRIVADYLIGWLVSIFGYEVAHFVLRIAQCLIYATAFAILFDALRLSILSSVATIAIFSLLGEELFAGEWLFRGVEAKTFAYGAAVAALGLSVRGKWGSATFLMVVSTWFHFLVGGFWMIALAVFAFIKQERIALPLKLIVYYSILVLPLIIAIGVEQYGQTPPSASPSPTEIWVEGTRHHSAPFYGAMSQWWFWDWAKGITATFVCLLALAIFIPYARNKQFLGLVVFLLSYVLIAVAIAFVDRNTLYFSKFIMFRPSSLALLLTIAAILIELQNSDSRRLLLLRQLSLAGIVLFCLVREFGALAMHELRPSRQDLDDLVAAIELHSRPGEIVLAQPPVGAFDDLQDFNRLEDFLPRQLNRPTLVSNKFPPTFPPMLIRWHELKEKRKALFAGRCDALSDFPVSILIVYDEETLETVQRCGNTVWRDEKFSLVSLSRQS